MSVPEQGPHLIRPERRLTDFRPEGPQGILDRVCDGGRWPDSTTLAEPLDSERIEWREILLVVENQLRQVRGGREQIVEQGRAEELALLVVDQVLKQGAADPLRYATDHLPVGNGRIDNPATIVHYNVALESD